MSSPIRFHGGKSDLAKHLRDLFPGMYTRYGEPYCGGCSVLFSGDGDFVSEFVNDIDGDLINFWKVLKNEQLFKKFELDCQLTPFSESIFHHCKHILDVGTTDLVQRAWAFYMVNRQSRQGLMKDYATPTSRLRKGMNENVSAYLSSVDGLIDFHQRLRRVEIHHKNAIDFILYLDAPDTFFYIDPPYVDSTRKSISNYKYEMSVKQHHELLQVLSVMQGSFMLSGYNSPLYERYKKLNGWNENTFKVNCPSGGGGERTEYIWRNY